MGYRIQSTGEHIFTEFGLREHFKGRINPPKPLTVEWLAENGVDSVFEGPQATGGTVYQYSQADGLEQIEGKWYTKYILGPVFTDRAATEGEPAKTAAEQEAEYKAMKDAEQAKAVRQQRTEKLKDSDWTQIADSTADKAAWAAHRQALRDITSQAGFPWTIDWPVKP
jgi:hypothetical protein